MLVQKLNNAVLFLRVFIVMLLAAGCGNAGQPEGNVLITGKFPAYADQNITISKMGIHEAIPVDTVKIDDDGLLTVGLTIDQPEFFLLKFDNRNYLTLLAEPDEQIEVTSPGMLRDAGYIVTGSPGSEKLSEMEKFINRHQERIDSVRNLYRGAEARGQFTHPGVLKEFEKSRAEIKEHIRETIMKDPGSLSALLFLNRRFGQEKLFAETEDFDLFHHVDSILTGLYPGNVHVTNHQEKVRHAAEMLEAERLSMERLAPGKPAPDFAMENYKGKEIRLSDLKGKVVLLYFWASSDPKSRQSNKTLKEIYAKNKNRGFEILAVSLDSYEEMWRNVIKAEELNWINVTDLQSIYSLPVFLYQVPKDLPYFYIIDDKQKIAWKGKDTEEMRKNLLSLLQH